LSDLNEHADKSIEGDTMTAADAKLRFIEASDFFAQGDWMQAEKALNRHLKMRPESWPGLCLKALIAAQTHREILAEQLWKQLLAADPSYVDGYCQLGLLCESGRRFSEAQAHFRKALQLDARYVKAHIGLGMVCQRQGWHSRAMQAYQNALLLEPDSVQAHFSMAVTYQEAGDFEQALVWFEKVLKLDPAHPSAASNLLYCQHFASQISADTRYAQATWFGKALESRVSTGTAWIAPAQPANLDNRLRIGLVSGDLRQHPVGYFLESAVRELSLLNLELIAFSNCADEDALTLRLKPSFQAWHVTDTWSDAALVAKIRQENIHVLIDLSGHTAGNRLAVFAARPAPVQVSWLGYFASTGLSRIDYVLADPLCVPAEEAHFFSEKIWHLPHTRFCFTPPLDAPAVAALPVLASATLTYGCFQDLSKIDDNLLKTWSRLLLAQPHARIRLQSVKLGHAEVFARFQARLGQLGVPLRQMVLLGPVRREDYLKAYAEIDLLLDTSPHPGGTTTAEALWMGVPTLTIGTPGMLGRQGASILTNAGLHDWVCADADEYVAKAIHWANPDNETRQALADLRAGLRAQVQASPLVNAALFAQHLHQALKGMWQQWCASPVVLPISKTPGSGLPCHQTDDAPGRTAP